AVGANDRTSQIRRDVAGCIIDERVSRTAQQTALELFFRAAGCCHLRSRHEGHLGDPEPFWSGNASVPSTVRPEGAGDRAGVLENNCVSRRPGTGLPHGGSDISLLGCPSLDGCRSKAAADLLLVRYSVDPWHDLH